MRAMLTGHRSVSPTCLDQMKKLLWELSAIDPVLTVISGGNLGTRNSPTGADRMWALAAYAEGIPYEIIVPYGYGEHYYGHNPEMMYRFHSMLERASDVTFVGAPDKAFNWRNNFKRNEVMIDSADHFVVCSDKEPREIAKSRTGGTAHCVRTMVECNIPVVDWVFADGSGYKRNYILT